MNKSTYLLIGGIILLGGIVVFGLTKKSTLEDTPKVDTLGSVAGNNGPVEIVKAQHDGSSLIPNQIVLQAGKSYDIQITPSRNGVGCMFAATVPTLGSETRYIKAGETFVISVPNAKPGTYPVVCTSMGMKQGEIVVQ